MADQSTTLKDLANQQQSMANDYKNNMAGYGQEQYNAVNEAALNNLKQQKQGINRSFNSRGLLNSGLNQGAQMGAENQTASGLGSAMANINQGNLGNYENLQNQALQTQGSAYGLDVQKNMLAYQQALAQQQMKQQQMQGIVGGIGSVGGMALGMA